MNIQLSDHFTYKRLLRFVLPSIVMMVFTSIYGVVDGLFVSNFAGKTAFAAVNLIMPVLMMLGSLGFMLGTGGSALVAKTLGEGRKKEANEYFSMLIYVTAIGGVIMSILGVIFMPKIAGLLGAEGKTLEYCILYGRILMISLTFFMLQNEFQSFLVTAEKPELGLRITVAAGVTNILLDFLFVGVFKMGIVGAAAATVISESVGGGSALFYFLLRNNSRLKLVKTKVRLSVLYKATLNGSSELMTNVSMSLVNMLYNGQLLRFAGENGVAAYGVIMYVNFIFVSIYLGYSIGSAPIIGYAYGAQNHSELKNMFRKSLIIILVCGTMMLILAQGLAGTLSGIFVGYDAELRNLTRDGFRIYSLAFLMMGFNIFGSAFFTALGNGPVSALLSFMRTLLFQVAAVLLLPMIFGIRGVWMSIVVAEILAMLLTLLLLRWGKSQYHYA